MDPVEEFEEFEVRIPSETEAGQQILRRIIQLLERLGFPAKDVFGVRLALDEALVNAIKHGNRMDSEKSVRIACQVSNEKVRIEIEDEGSGFDWNHLPDPTDLENLEKPCGRGVMLMRAFLNGVEYNEQGNCVILEKLKGVDVETDDSDE
ncbi:MAG: ATP-binding protein [Planctomycetes bacterium]|nr:ATP-binding protein [Planctomycetota bacterium]